MGSGRRAVEAGKATCAQDDVAVGFGRDCGDYGNGGGKHALSPSSMAAPEGSTAHAGGSFVLALCLATRAFYIACRRWPQAPCSGPISGRTSLLPSRLQRTMITTELGRQKWLQNKTGGHQKAQNRCGSCPSCMAAELLERGRRD
jgi:hypothetical protein